MEFIYKEKGDGTLQLGVIINGVHLWGANHPNPTVFNSTIQHLKMQLHNAEKWAERLDKE